METLVTVLIVVVLEAICIIGIKHTEKEIKKLKEEVSKEKRS